MDGLQTAHCRALHVKHNYYTIVLAVMVYIDDHVHYNIVSNLNSVSYLEVHFYSIALIFLAVHFFNASFHLCGVSL